MMGYGYGGGFPGHMTGYAPFGGGLMIMGFVLFAVLLGLGVWALVRRDHRTSHATTAGTTYLSESAAPPAPAAHIGRTGTDPLEIVRERLARGEIDVAEYAEIVAALQGPASPSA